MRPRVHTITHTLNSGTSIFLYQSNICLQAHRTHVEHTTAKYTYMQNTFVLNLDKCTCKVIHFWWFTTKCLTEFSASIRRTKTLFPLYGLGVGFRKKINKHFQCQTIQNFTVDRKKKKEEDLVCALNFWQENDLSAEKRLQTYFSSKKFHVHFIVL
jgi:hypothetical protein